MISFRTGIVALAALFLMHGLSARANADEKSASMAARSPFAMARVARGTRQRGKAWAS